MSIAIIKEHFKANRTIVLFSHNQTIVVNHKFITGEVFNELLLKSNKVRVLK